MNIYKVIIGYRGTYYSGWQSQKNNNGIQDILKKTLYNVFKLDCDVIGASRTDSGVHAEGQVALFCFSINIDYDLLFLKKIINDHLPSDIWIRDLEIADKIFHPRKDVKRKTYSYFLSLQKVDPLISSYVYFHRIFLNVDIFESLLNKFVGTHHFGSFVTGKYPEELYIKTIEKCEIIKNESDLLFKDKNVIQIDIIGNSFLRYMIRRIVGACITLASAKKSIYSIEFLLKNPNSRRPLFKAPAEGLMLRNIEYKKIQN
jgi:tRNA pseudouridine38-40 synthase